MKLIVGLGNPGDYYKGSRHNVGFMAVSQLSKKIGASFSKKECNARTAHGTINGTDVVLARPQTYMNNSGESVNALMRKFKVSKEDLIVIHDDMDLPVAKLRIRSGGSAGGHNGIKSIIAKTATQDFTRIKLGIGHPSHQKDEVIDYVLENFTKEEKQELNTSIDKACEAVIDIIENGVEYAMNKYNGSEKKSNDGKDEQ
jgi:PTH1 family peptidyl-tRNA hydrolase